MISIIYENNDVAVINKPAGLLVHPTIKGERGTLVDWLLQRYPEIKGVGDKAGSFRPGIVHRLDKDTSGVMIVAKRQASFNWLKSQFKNRKVVKRYLALVYGLVKDKQGVINKAIGKSHKDWRKKNVADFLQGRRSRTKYRVLSYFYFRDHKFEPMDVSEKIGLTKSKVQIFSLLEVTPETGRTHQIRVHLSSIGHPIVGDSLYKFKRQVILPEVGRQFLHAYSLQLVLPDGQEKKFTADLPQNLRGVIPAEAGIYAWPYCMDSRFRGNDRPS